MGFLDPETPFDESLAAIETQVDAVRDGLRCGKPTGTCQTCSVRRNAFYQPLVSLGGRNEVAEAG